MTVAIINWNTGSHQKFTFDTSDMAKEFGKKIEANCRYEVTYLNNK